MPLDAQQEQKLRQWMSTKKTLGRCPGCSQNNWGGGEIVVAPTFAGGSIAIGGPTVPMVQLVCNVCAYVAFLAAVPMGLP